MCTCVPSAFIRVRLQRIISGLYSPPDSLCPWDSQRILAIPFQTQKQNHVSLTLCSWRWVLLPLNTKTIKLPFTKPGTEGEKLHILLSFCPWGCRILVPNRDLLYRPSEAKPNHWTTRNSTGPSVNSQNFFMFKYYSLNMKVVLIEMNKGRNTCGKKEWWAC